MFTNINVKAKKTKGMSILDSILLSRGITDKKEYFSPETKKLVSPFIFADMEKAVSLINEAIEKQDKILIWGDFDADGVTSTSILCKTLNVLGASYSYFLPDRAKMGHGLNLKELLSQKSKNKVKLLITVDCGISNLKEIKLLKSLGVKIIVTDHHEPPEILPDADCILNPLANNSLKSDLEVSVIEKVSCLAGAGVAMKLAFALLGEGNKNIKDEIIALSAIGTISDVVPLVGENRIIAARGLVEINKGKHKGVKRLFERQKLTEKIKSEDVAFILAPRINAAGRLDSPFESIKLLLEDNILAIDMTIDKLDMLNKVRQGLCEKVYQETLTMIKKANNCIVLYNDSWNLGIIGIVASKLVEKFNVPVFLITKDENKIYRCSIRSTEQYDIAKILKSLEDCFLGYGGHAGAGGFSADSNVVEIDELKKRIEETVLECRDEDKISNAVNIDIELDGDDLTFDLLEDLNKLEPYGANNEKPVFLFRNARLISHKQIGKELNHISYSIRKDSREFGCLYWKRPVLGFNSGETLDIVFRPEVNTFNDEKRIQLITECILNDRLQEKFYHATKLFDHRQKTGILDKINDYVKNKNGEVKIWATSVSTKKMLEKYSFIKENILDDNPQNEKTVMLFDYPPTLESFRELIKGISPENIHLMKNDFSKNPDDYISLICGMVKYATNNKDGVIDLKTLAYNTGLDEICVQTALELLEKIESVRIDDIDRVIYLKAPRHDTIHSDSMFEIFKDEFRRVIDFKDYLLTADLNSIEELCKN